MLCSSSKKGMVCFSIISNFAVTARVSVNNARADLFLKVTVMQIEKALINDRLRVLKYSQNFAFQLFTILQ